MIVRLKRFFTRPIEDFSAGSMTSLHSLITFDDEEKKLRGTITRRDCESEISFEFWTGKDARPGGRKRAADMLTLLRNEIDEFMQDYDNAAAKLEGDKDE